MQFGEHSLDELLKGGLSGLRKLRDHELRAIANAVLDTYSVDRSEHQIEFYKPVSAKAQKVHESKARRILVSGGNGSSKTETVLVEVVMCATGVFPESQLHLREQKWRGPISCRIVVESLTTTLNPIIIPKLQYNRWTGIDQPGGIRGHWGWIPKDCLIDGSWDRSWSARDRMLTVWARDPWSGEIVGQSTIQFMSHDQSPEDFASGDFHLIVLDEPPPEAIYVESEARTMRVNGRILLSMTWPDDPTTPVDWIFDRIYEKAQDGPDRDPDIESFKLFTTENMTLDQDAIAAQIRKWSKEMTQVRIYGEPIRFSNLVHKNFTDELRWWDFLSNDMVIPGHAEDGVTPMNIENGSTDLVQYTNVLDFDSERLTANWPVVCLLDPHPRKPHMFWWVAVDPFDDYYAIAELLTDQNLDKVYEAKCEIEAEHHMNVRMHLADPNMMRNALGTNREVTWQDEFASHQMWFDLADDAGVGRTRLNDYFRPDARTRRPRFMIHPRCKVAIKQFKRFAWAEWSTKSADRDIKQVAREKDDDYPAMGRYLMNAMPTFVGLREGPIIINAERRPRRGYS